MSIPPSTIFRHGASAGDHEPVFPVVVILVPEEGFAPASMRRLSQIPDGTALVILEYSHPEPDPDHGYVHVESRDDGKAFPSPTHTIRDGMLVEKDQRYFIPARVHAEIRDGRFAIVRRPTREDPVWLPDFTLMALADCYRGRLTAVLTGQPGLLGADIVRREGGYVYFLGDPDGREPTVGAWLFDARFSIKRLKAALAADRPRIRQKQPRPNAPDSAGRVGGSSLSTLLQREVFPLLIRDRVERGPLRIWIAGDANKMMAFRTTVGLTEWLHDRKLNYRVQVFATGLNRREVQQARLGIFEEADLSTLETTLRERYFTRREDGLYQFSKGMQQSCVFATHHLVADPPFSFCDLILCADPLTLLTETQQKKVFQSFHYALNPGGCLLLPDQAARQAAPPRDEFSRRGASPGLYVRRTGKSGPALGRPGPRPLSEAEKEAEKILMSGYVPAAMLVDEDLRVIRFYGVMSRYLRIPGDRPSLHLLQLIREELFADLTQLLESVSQTGQAGAVDGIYLSDEPHTECRMEVIPVLNKQQHHRLVIIREKEAPLRTGRRGVGKGDVWDQHLRSLEKQNQQLRDQLQSEQHHFRENEEGLRGLIREINLNNEELKSLNEEFHSLYEDLRGRYRDLEVRASRTGAVIAAIQRPLLVMLDTGCIQTVNDAFLELFGLPGGSIEGEPFYEAAGGIFNLPKLKERLQALAHADIVDFELKHAFRGMDEKILNFNANRIKGDGGSIGGVVLFVEDVQGQLDLKRV